MFLIWDWGCAVLQLSFHCVDFCSRPFIALTLKQVFFNDAHYPATVMMTREMGDYLQFALTIASDIISLFIFETCIHSH